MKIVTRKQMRLDELIKYVWENEEGSTNRYISHKGKTVTVDNSGVEFSSRDNGIVLKDDTFTVEVEEELTEDTVFDELAFVYDDYAHRPSSGAMVHKSIHDILNHKSPIYKIYALVNRSLVLIWSAEHGTPTEGTLEL